MIKVKSHRPLGKNQKSSWFTVETEEPLPISEVIDKLRELHSCSAYEEYLKKVDKEEKETKTADLLKKGTGSNMSQDQYTETIRALLTEIYEFKEPYNSILLNLLDRDGDIHAVEEEHPYLAHLLEQPAGQRGFEEEHSFLDTLTDPDLALRELRVGQEMAATGKKMGSPYK